MTKSAGRAVVLFCLLTIAAVAPAADWNRWLGPDQNGKSPETGIFGTETPTLDVTWSHGLGKAYSAIAIADGKAVTMFGDGKTDWLIAFDASNGEELWRYRIDKMFPKIGGADGGPLSMPVIDGDVVYGLGGKGHLFAVSLDDGKKIWRTRVDRKLGGKPPSFGFATTPLVVDDLLFVQTGGPDGHSLTALDRQTGKPRWATGDEEVGYQSPILVEIHGAPQIIAVTDTSVTGLLPRDGTVLWSREHGLVDRNGWATPVMISDDTFVLVEGAGSSATRITRTGGLFSAEEVWLETNLKKNFSVPVVYGDHLYGYDGSFLACVETLTGEQVWKTRLDASGLILVDGHLVVFSEDGNVVVIAASPEGYDEKARVKVSETGGYTFPSFSDGGVFVRNLDDIARVDIRMF